MWISHSSQDPQYYGQGTTDGTFQSVRYFACHDGNGLFVSCDKLSEELTHSGPHGVQHNAPHVDQQNKQTQPKPPTRFKLGDRVVIFKKNGTSVHGTVRWAGEYGYYDNKMKYHSFAAVGIEAVSCANPCIVM